MSLQALIAMLPCGKSEPERKLRSEIFESFDTASTGRLLPADIERGLYLLRANGSPPAAVHPPIPAVDLAFDAVTKGTGARFVAKAEFRLLFTYLKWYIATPSPLPATRLYHPTKSPKALPPLTHGLQSTSSAGLLTAARPHLLATPNRSGLVGAKRGPAAEELAWQMRQRASVSGSPPRMAGLFPNAPRYATF